MPQIPFNVPPYFADSEAALLSSLRSGKLSGRGPITQEVREQFNSWFPELDDVLLTTSCTHALETTAILLNLEAGDEVIVPSFTFVSGALAYHMHGATLRFCDIRPDTLNLDENLLEALINENTRAIVPVHYGGVACEMDAIMEIANRHNIVVIEDNAHGLFGKYKDQNLGTIGHMSTCSFHETKNITCGEGGALFIRDGKFSDRAEILIEKGTNRSQFLNGQVDKYSWVDKGSSFVVSDLLVSLLQSQLAHRSEIQSRRQQLWHTYYEGLRSWANRQSIGLPQVPEHCSQAYHMFYCLLPSRHLRDQFIATMKEKGIQTTFHYLPLEQSAMGRKISRSNDSCPVSENISGRIVRLPMFYDLSDSDQLKIIEETTKFEAGDNS